MEALDGLPPVIHCSLQKKQFAALWDYANGIKIEGLEKPKTDIDEGEEGILGGSC